MGDKIEQFRTDCWDFVGDNFPTIAALFLIVVLSIFGAPFWAALGFGLTNAAIIVCTGKIVEYL